MSSIDMSIGLHPPLWKQPPAASTTVEGSRSPHCSEIRNGAGEPNAHTQRRPLFYLTKLDASTGYG